MLYADESLPFSPLSLHTITIQIHTIGNTKNSQINGAFMFLTQIDKNHSLILILINIIIMKVVIPGPSALTMASGEMQTPRSYSGSSLQARLSGQLWLYRFITGSQPSFARSHTALQGLMGSCWKSMVQMGAYMAHRKKSKSGLQPVPGTQTGVLPGVLFFSDTTCSLN